MQSQYPNSVAGRGPSTHWADRTARHRLTHFARQATAVERRREETLAEWYGTEQAPAEIAAHRSPPRLMGEILDEALREIGVGDACVLDRIRALWPTIVGAEVARRAMPVALRNRILTVEVPSETWRYVLEREHRERVNGRLRAVMAGDVIEVRFTPPGRMVRPDMHSPDTDRTSHRDAGR